MKKESKVANVSLNFHQSDLHTIQMYVLNVRDGDNPHRPVTVEHPDKHPNKLKPNGEPYAREHESLFNILKDELVRLGKWQN
jgi:hypothetical protein